MPVGSICVNVSMTRRAALPVRRTIKDIDLGCRRSEGVDFDIAGGPASSNVNMSCSRMRSRMDGILAADMATS
jgi:hypothetical protein